MNEKGYQYSKKLQIFEKQMAECVVARSPRRQKSTFFQICLSGESLKETRSEEIFPKKVDFSLWGNRKYKKKLYTLSMSKFCGFKSRCNTRRWWQKSLFDLFTLQIIWPE